MCVCVYISEHVRAMAYLSANRIFQLVKSVSKKFVSYRGLFFVLPTQSGIAELLDFLVYVKKYKYFTTNQPRLKDVKHYPIYSYNTRTYAFTYKYTRVQTYNR